MPDRHVSDRYADAVTARRAELRAQRRLLGPGIRAELRDALALVRAAGAAGTTAAFADLRREVEVHLDHTSARALPPLVAAAVVAIEEWAHRRWTDEARTALLEVALLRELPVLPVVPPREPGPAAHPGQPRPVRWIEVLADAGAWRLAVLPLVVAPLTGPAGPAVLLPALGLGVLVLAVVLRARRAATEQARVRLWCAELVALAQERIDAELGRRTAMLAARAAPVLDDALGRRRRAVVAELDLLAPEVSGAPA